MSMSHEANKLEWYLFFFLLSIFTCSADRIQDDREARRLQVHSARGAVYFQLRRHRSWDELNHSLFFLLLLCD